jgi:hypothetical protein
MKTKKISLIAGISVCALIVLFTVVYAAITNAFVTAQEYLPPCDIEESYARDAIEWAVRGRLMDVETVDGQAYFSPKSKVTRGEMAKILACYLEIDIRAYEDGAVGFADEAQVPAELLPYVRAAVSGGYVKLFSDYTYRASAALTREETADIFAPLCEESAATGKSTQFSDIAEVGLYFEESVKKLVDLERLIGYPDGKLHPKNEITREELAMLLYRLSLMKKSS